jgi:hypothetical protein
MLMTLILAANACGVAWDPVRVLPEGMRSKLEGAQVVSPCRVASLPAAVQAFLLHGPENEKHGMADPGQPWNNTCLRPIEGLPSRQLIIVAGAGRNWVVHYREGGETVMEMAVVLEVDGETVRQLWEGLCVGDAGQRRCIDPNK